MIRKVLSIILVINIIAVMLLAGCSGGKRTTASAAKWSVVVDTDIKHSSNIEGFFNESYGLTVGFGGEIHYTYDGGETWPDSVNSSMCRYCLDIVDENLAWTGGNGNNVRVTKDGGRTWSEVSDAKLNSIHLDIDFVDENTGWVATNKKCAVTIDGGSTWTEMNLPEDLKSIATISLRTSEDGYILSTNGMLFITSDGGSTWSSKDIELEKYGVIDEKGKPGLYKSNVALADINFSDEDNGIIVFSGIVPGEGTKTYCLTTNDGGESWVSEELKPKEGFIANKIYISDDGNYLTLGSNDSKLIVLKREE
ncbi:MAG: hypothetical protein GX379_00505 [Clostridiales bacterium]|nr:hypothetical protein [Clostridiales bacterium]